MQEIEVKILEIDREEIEHRLTTAGASMSFNGEMLAIFFDSPDKAIAGKRDLLRLRKEGDKPVLTYKKFVGKGEAKIMEEYETTVSSIENTTQILAMLGYSPTRRTRKFRTQYDLGKTHVVIDDYQDNLSAIPPFIEIEAPDMASLYSAVEILGYQASDCKNWNTFDLMKHYGLA